MCVTSHFMCGTILYKISITYIHANSKQLQLCQHIIDHTNIISSLCVCVERRESKGDTEIDRDIVREGHRESNRARARARAIAVAWDIDRYRYRNGDRKKKYTLLHR